jgi:small ligand-binding sensory domain FIST
MRWAAAIATDAHLDDAVGNATDEVLAGLAGARADLVIAFVTDHHAARLARLAPALARDFGGALIVGCTASGALGGGVEVEHQAALSLTAASLPDVRITPLRLDPVPRRWPEQIDLDDGAAAAFVLLPCPLTFPVEELLEHLDERWPAAVKVGGLASGGMSEHALGGNTLFLGDERLAGGAVGVALEGDLHVDTIVAQGCRAVGEPLIVTRAHGNLALELDGQPALAALETLTARMTPAERALARHSLFVGLAMTHGGGPLGRADFLVRNLLGLDAASGALAVGAPLAAGQVIQFHLRDPRTAAEDVAALLADHEGAAPEGALLFSCVGRGRLLFGESHHDSLAFRRALGEVPLGGFFCNGEIGPVHRRTFLHGYTSAFALFRRASPLS